MSCLCKEKTKNIIAIAFTVFYIIMIVLSLDFRLLLYPDSYMSFSSFPRYPTLSFIISLMPLITPVLALIFMLSLNKEYKLKKWLLPIAFGLMGVRAIISRYSSFANIELYTSTPYDTAIYVCGWLALILIIFMFIGTLFNRKHFKFLKYGAFCYAVLYLATFIIEFIAVDGFAYFQNIPAVVLAIAIESWVRSFACILFYVGIFLIADYKKKTDLE